MTPANRTELIEAIRRHFAFGRTCESPTCLERGYPVGMWCKCCVLDALEALTQPAALTSPPAPSGWQQRIAAMPSGAAYVHVEIRDEAGAVLDSFNVDAKDALPPQDNTQPSCGGTGFIAIPPSYPGPPEGEFCPGCPSCEGTAAVVAKAVEDYITNCELPYGWTTHGLRRVIRDALPPAPEGSPANAQRRWFEPSAREQQSAEMESRELADAEKDHQRRLGKLCESFADDVERMSDDELIEECRANGEDPEEIAEHTRGVLQAAYDKWAAAQPNAQEADASPAKDPIASAVNAQLDPLKDELKAIGHKLEKEHAGE